MVKRGKKTSKDTPKKKSAKLSVPFSDDQGELNVSSDIAGSLLQSPQNIQTVSNGTCSVLHGSPAHASSTISDSATILAYLKKTDAPNEALSERVQELKVDPSSIPILQRQHQHQWAHT